MLLSEYKNDVTKKKIIYALVVIKLKNTFNAKHFG